MAIAGTDDGVYRVSGVNGSGEFETGSVLDVDGAYRVRRFDDVDGVFAATMDGLFRSTDGETWTDLGVPRDQVHSVAASPSGERLYAGTHPSHLYVAQIPASPPTEQRTPEWRELAGFQELPSRDEWHLPRHGNASQIRSLGTHPDAPERIVAGVEVGGVHLSDDAGETWSERTDGRPDDAYHATLRHLGETLEERFRGVHDDVHHLLVVDADEFVASTGYGLYRTVDAGRSWSRLDEGVEQTYFREAIVHDGVLYASGAAGPSPNWEDGADAGLFESRDGRRLEPATSPRPDEVVVSWTVLDGAVVGGTNRGTLLRKRSSGWSVAGSLPVDGQGIRSLCPAPAG